MLGFRVHHNCARPHMGLEGGMLADRVDITTEGQNRWLTITQNAAMLVVEGSRGGEADGQVSS